MHTDMNMHHSQPPAPQDNGPMSYFAYGKHSSSIIAHIALMVAGWCFILPVGTCYLSPSSQESKYKKIRQS
jgi:hypothetical protein